MFPSIFIMFALATGAEPVAYAKPEMLLEPKDAIQNTNSYHYLDVRSSGLYDDGHIPTAVLAEMGKWSRAVSDGKADTAFWKTALQIVGVTPNLPTVVYGADVKEVCRAWWLLKYAGVKDVRVLNGGVDGYVAAGGKLAKEPVKHGVKPHDWTPEPTRLSDKNRVLQLVKDKAAQIVDARSAGEFTGAEAMSKKGGHIPGATHLEWTDFIDAKTKRFKAADELAKLIAEKKLDLSKPCLTYCQSGGRASVIAFGLELMGAKDVRNYYRSWSEWGNADDTPIEK